MDASPGKYPQHYSPNATVIVVEDSARQAEETLSIVEEMRSRGHKPGVMARQEHETLYRDVNVKVLGPGDDGRTCASRLFHILRDFDAEDINVIVAEGIPEKGLGLAVMNRLRKAAGPGSNT
jgi:L-threonylcarbamoyladenylate synthase